ncbi:hypothetical protein D3C71_1803290 [compost metagenome]
MRRNAVVGTEEIRCGAGLAVVEQGAGTQVAVAVANEDHARHRAAFAAELGFARHVNVAGARLPHFGYRWCGGFGG